MKNTIWVAITFLTIIYLVLVMYIGHCKLQAGMPLEEQMEAGKMMW